MDNFDLEQMTQDKPEVVESKVLTHLDDVNIEEEYQMKDEIEHILDRPGTWIGSMATELDDELLFVPSKNRIIKIGNVSRNNGLMKLIDEVLSNSVDEHRRKDALYKVTQINVEVNSDGSVVIEDNGGIPIKYHKVAKKVLPELIFGTLRSSKNYNDSQQREVVGTNGLGAKLTNIYSTSFIVETADGKNSIKIEWANNMRSVINKDLKKYPEIGFELIPSQKHGTKTSFKIDLKRFELNELPVSFIRMVQKRCIEAVATNPELTINFKSDAVDGVLNSSWRLPSFEDYIKLFLTPEQIETMLVYKNKKDVIVMVPENLGFDFSFVNGAVCSKGTHIKKVQNQIVEQLLNDCKKNDMELFTENDITNRISLFINTTIINPAYESQTKEKLATKIDKYTLNFSKDFLDNLKNTTIFENLKAYYDIKYREVKQKELNKLNKTIKTTKVTKLIQCVSKNAETNELWLFEGDSAGNGFRKARNLNQSAYLLRGKILNTFNLNRDQILNNKELREVIATLGILFGEPKKNLNSIKYRKIVIATDMDYDGHHICGLLLAFFVKHFPELFKAGLIYRALSPIIIANKGKEKKYYYSLEAYEKESQSLKGWEIIYTKGLGGLSDEDYYQMVRNQKLYQFKIQDMMDIEAVSIWFDKSTEQRKLILLEDSGYYEESDIEN